MRIVYAALLTGVAYAIVAALLLVPYLLPAIRNSPSRPIRPVETSAPVMAGSR